LLGLLYLMALSNTLPNLPFEGVYQLMNVPLLDTKEQAAPQLASTRGVIGPQEVTFDLWPHRHIKPGEVAHTPFMLPTGKGDKIHIKYNKYKYLKLV
jgi:hypothetical protein